MILKNCRYQDFAEKIQRENKKIIIYGAGMIGQVVIPSILQQYGLEEKVLYYVDRDKSKSEQSIPIGRNSCEIKSPDALFDVVADIVVLVTNSNFYPIIEFLDTIETLHGSEVYLFPLMQLEELKHGKNPALIQTSTELLIPRKIHYCWFSENPIPDSLQKCIDSWKKKCPNYEIICWNENNYDVNQRRYTAEAYANQKYGFVADVARFDILYEHGGVYLDTDVELLKSLDEMLYQEAFIGTEKWGNINSGGGCGAVPQHPMIKALLQRRENLSFVREDGKLNLDTNGIYETGVFLDHGFEVKNETQVINHMTVYPPKVFHPLDYITCEQSCVPETVSVHYFSGTWMDAKEIKNRTDTQDKYKKVLRRIEEQEGKANVRLSHRE